MNDRDLRAIRLAILDFLDFLISMNFLDNPHLACTHCTDLELDCNPYCFYSFQEQVQELIVYFSQFSYTDFSFDELIFPWHLAAERGYWTSECCEIFYFLLSQVCKQQAIQSEQEYYNCIQTSEER